MQSKILGIAITFLLILASNYTIANCNFPNLTFSEIDQVSEEEHLAEKEHKKRNQEAVDFLNDLINKLEADNKTDKAEALKAMRDHIKKNLKKDTGTIIYRAAKEGKKTAEGKDNKKALKEYVDKIYSATAKKIFKILLSAKGTGQTTGHIATLMVTNNSGHYISLHPELIFIYLSDKYQSYVAYIPIYIAIAPGVKVPIPIYGYCANPHVPPVPLGESMPSPDKWIPIDKSPSGGFALDGNPPMIPEPMNPPGGSTGPPQKTITIYVSDIPSKPSFDPGMITTMISSPGYSEDDDDTEDPEIKVTWPGTPEEIGGSFDPVEDPLAFAQLTVEGLTRIIDEVDSIQSSGLYITPFSNDKEKEKEAVIQQAFWIFVAGVAGDEYEEEDFTNNIYQQFETATGQSVTALPPEQKEQIDVGAVAFWTIYVAVGVKAKVLSDETQSVPISNPEKSDDGEKEKIEKKPEDCCESKSYCKFNPQLDFDMKIGDEWEDHTKRRKIISDARKSMENKIDITDKDLFNDFNISKNPTSATSFWKPGVVGGFASAYAKTLFQKSDGNSEWVGGTEELDTRAEGTMNCTLAYDTGDSCRAVVAGTALIRIRASSSAFDAMAGNRHNEDDEDQLAFLRATKYGAEKALEWLILRGRGKTNKSFQNHVKDDLKDKIKGEITSEIESEVQKMGDEYLAEYLKELGLSAEDLSLDILKVPDLEESLEELLGFEILSLADLEATISEGIQATLNLFFVSNTSARADGSLTVKVGSDVGSVVAHTSVHYNRKSTEKTSDAISWTGAQCRENVISDVQPNTLSIETNGNVHLFTEALNKYGFGNGSAKAYLESMNLQMLAGLCFYEENDTTKFTLEVVGNLSWFANSKEHQTEMNEALEPLENEIRDSLYNEINTYQYTHRNTPLVNYTGEMLKNYLDQKIKTWAAKHPFYWRDCSN